MDRAGLKGQGIQWDLSELYQGPDDPRLEADLVEARRRAEAFAQAYRGKVASGQLDGPALARALAEYEALSELEHRPSFYASLRFKLTIDGAERELTDGEVMALLRHSDRGLRERAFTTFLETHASHSLVLTAIFNNVLLDHKVDCTLRHYDDVVLPTHLANE